MSDRHVKILRAAFPECVVTRGWHLAGPGPARYGWGARHPSGKVRYLGRTAREAVASILAEIDARARYGVACPVCGDDQHEGACVRYVCPTCGVECAEGGCSQHSTKPQPQAV